MKNNLPMKDWVDYARNLVSRVEKSEIRFNDKLKRFVDERGRLF